MAHVFLFRNVLSITPKTLETGEEKVTLFAIGHDLWTAKKKKKNARGISLKEFRVNRYCRKTVAALASSLSVKWHNGAICVQRRKKKVWELSWDALSYDQGLNLKYLLFRNRAGLHELYRIAVVVFPERLMFSCCCYPRLVCLCVRHECIISISLR